MPDAATSSRPVARLRAARAAVALAVATTGAVTGAVATSGPALAAKPADPGSLSLAVFGDAPYGYVNGDTREADRFHLFVDSINNDPTVSSVLDVGDIHSGKDFCTEAYDRRIATEFARFSQSLVYTPGDNEWTDCHKPGEGGATYTSNGLVPNPSSPDEYQLGDPAANLDLVRSIFFAKPGKTLGQGHLEVQSQGAPYVENVRWQRKGVQFVSVNIPGGSNNDTDPWFGAKAPVTQAQKDEVTHRTAADLAWIDSSFAQAKADGAKAVVVMEQADMWDLDGKDRSHLANYEPFVKSLADHTNKLGKPVLLLDGDSHRYRSDNPFSASAPCETEAAIDANHPEAVSPTVACTESVAGNHAAYDVPNFHRITVHGSTFPFEWLKLTISPSNQGTFGPFSWQRVETGITSETPSG